MTPDVEFDARAYERVKEFLADAEKGTLSTTPGEYWNGYRFALDNIRAYINGMESGRAEWVRVRSDSKQS